MQKALRILPLLFWSGLFFLFCFSSLASLQAQSGTGTEDWIKEQRIREIFQAIEQNTIILKADLSEMADSLEISETALNQALTELNQALMDSRELENRLIQREEELTQFYDSWERDRISWERSNRNYRIGIYVGCTVSGSVTGIVTASITAKDNKAIWIISGGTIGGVSGLVIGWVTDKIIHFFTK